MILNDFIKVNPLFRSIDKASLALASSFCASSLLIFFLMARLAIPYHIRANIIL